MSDKKGKPIFAMDGQVIPKMQPTQRQMTESRKTQTQGSAAARKSATAPENSGLPKANGSGNAG